MWATIQITIIYCFLIAVFQLQHAVFGAREKNKFKNRMLDMVIGINHPLRRMKSFSDRVKDITPDGMIDENVYGLVDAVHKHNKDANANFLSPRFMPIMPEKLNTKRFGFIVENKAIIIF